MLSRLLLILLPFWSGATASAGCAVQLPEQIASVLPVGPPAVRLLAAIDAVVTGVPILQP
jgi:iron complex transport system substrate-binding protein